MLCATPNTLSVGQRLADLSPLDGRGRIQTGPEAVPLTNENGAYICEVTAIGRLLAMLAHAPAPADGGGVLTLSVLNTRDPGNHKIHRMSWSAGELVTALLPYLQPDSWARRPLAHWASVTDGETSAAIGSAPTPWRGRVSWPTSGHGSSGRPHRAAARKSSRVSWSASG
nr:hypothetical protein [Streptomyces antimycoticus]